MHAIIYENTSLITSPRGSPIPQYDYRRAVHTHQLAGPSLPYGPPESAGKNYEIQKLYDEVMRLRRKDEAHTKWRQEVETKWKESREEVRELQGEVKLLKEENKQLLAKVYTIPRVIKYNSEQGHSWDKEDQWRCVMRSKNSAPVPREHSGDMEYQKMKDEMKSLNLVIQKLNEDNTELIHTRTKAEEESKELRDCHQRQKAKVYELIRKDEEKTNELVRLNFKVLNCQNENANLNLIVKENLARIK